MTTSTNELSTPEPLHDFLFKYAASVQAIYGGSIGVDRLFQAAQRLSELGEPDCVWSKVGETFDTACNARYRDGAYSTWKTCPNCGGSVKPLLSTSTSS